MNLFPCIDSELSRARWMYAIGLAYLLAGYLGTNELASLNPWNRPSLPTMTSLDLSIPLCSWTVIFYILYYPILLTPLVFPSDVKSLTRLTLAQAGLNTFAFAMYAAFPTPVDRPVAFVPENVFDHILSTLYRADHPYNSFPSLHVAQTMILVLFYFYFPIRQTGLFALHAFCAVTVTASAVLIKQHTVSDAIAGIFLAWLAALVLFRERPFRAQ